MALAFWVLWTLVFYTYLGYGLLIGLLAALQKKIFRKTQAVYSRADEFPRICVLVAAYNEEDFIREKISNTLALDYPAGKVDYYFVSDGSNDTTAKIIEKHPQIRHFHKAKRQGKTAAVERVMPFVEAEIVIFTDANTMLNKDALKALVQHFKNPKVGAVAGEKRISTSNAADASAAGEGLYWKYESQLKKWDSDFYSVVGAAGELFAVRKKLYEPVPKNALLEDFMTTMQIAGKGYRVIYEPNAYALEGPSENVGEEFKRKKRISAGGWQSSWMLKKLMNPFQYGKLSFQFVSHRVLRWTITPFALILLLLLNSYLAFEGPDYFKLLLILQLLFYGLALIGWILARKKIKYKVFFVPFYFCFMNFAVLIGLYSLLAGEQSVVWEKAKRAQ